MKRQPRASCPEQSRADRQKPPRDHRGATAGEATRTIVPERSRSRPSASRNSATTRPPRATASQGGAVAPEAGRTRKEYGHRSRRGETTVGPAVMTTRPDRRKATRAVVHAPTNDIRGRSPATRASTHMRPGQDSPPRVTTSGLYRIDGLADVEWRRIESPFGDPSDEFDGRPAPSGDPDPHTEHRDGRNRGQSPDSTVGGSSGRSIICQDACCHVSTKAATLT